MQDDLSHFASLRLVRFFPSGLCGFGGVFTSRAIIRLVSSRSVFLVSDMPQPLRKWDARLKFGPAALEQRPKLAVKIAQVAAAWTNFEVHLGYLLAEITRSKADVGVSMYLALSGSAAQEAVFMAVAERYVPEKMVDTLADILRSKVRARAKERNAIIHALWAVHPDDPVALVHCPPQSAIAERGEWMTHVESFGADLIPYSPRFDGLMVYTERDFDAILARIKEAREAIDAFNADLEAHRTELHQHILALKNVVEDAQDEARPDTPQDDPPKSSEPAR